MALFSERSGYKPVRSQLQYEGMDDAFRMDVWNYIRLTTRDWDRNLTESYGVLVALWLNFWRRDIEQMPGRPSGFVTDMRAWVLTRPWTDVFDFLEFLVDRTDLAVQQRGLRDGLNSIMERNLAAYRFVGRQIVQVDSDTDVEAIEDALADTTGVPGAQHHLGQALAHLADRKNPDYANSIKESVSAVESVCRQITSKPKATLGDGIKALKSAGVTIHPALEKGWLSLYGYTSDADGVRHAALDKPDLDQADARYFLVSCAAFVSLLLHHARDVKLVGEP